MILDQNLLFSDAQAVTAAAGSDNTIDLGAANQNPGVGEQDLYVFAVVTTAFTDGSSDSTLVVALESDSTTSITPDATRDLFTFAALSPVGTVKYAKLDPNGAGEMLRYHRLKYTPANGNLTTGSITAGIVVGISAFRAYAKNYVS